VSEGLLRASQVFDGGGHDIETHNSECSAMGTLDSDRTAGGYGRITAAGSRPSPVVQWPPRVSRRRPAGSREAGLKITLRIYNYAQVAPAELSEAEKVASVIFRKAGIEPAWIDCPLSEEDLDRFPACQQSLTPSHFVLRLINQPLPNFSIARAGDIGLALACREDDAGCSAYLSYKSVMNWAGRADTSADRILGHAMAHEIGHLVLGPVSHSRSGVMCADWDMDDLAVMARKLLYFTHQQAHSLRVEVRKRPREL